jgi:glycine cleavage system H lipoate-binding protein
MRCPFLREEQVKACQASPFRKRIARSAAQGESERCSSADYVTCPEARQSREAHPSPSRCPFLQESLVQYCAAVPAPTYVPWSESPDSRCTHDGHRFCELYLSLAGASGRGPARRGDDPAELATVDVLGVPMPMWLAYSENHLWLDVGDDGLCHLGVDAFLTRLVGQVERLSFLPSRSTARPAVVLTVGGADLSLAFPHPLPIVATNARIRSRLDRLVSDPYGLGWLFEARWEEPRATSRESTATPPLRRGRAAREWMEREQKRVAQFVHEHVLPRRSRGLTALADGGTAAPGLLTELAREEILQLFAELFPLPTTPSSSRNR